MSVSGGWAISASSTAKGMNIITYQPGCSVEYSALGVARICNEIHALCGTAHTYRPPYFRGNQNDCYCERQSGFASCFMYAGITCTDIFSSSAHKRPAHLFVIGGALLLESIIWCTRIVRCPEFGGCPLFGSSKCIESTGIAVGASTVVRYTVDVCYWECPLTDRRFH